MIRTLLNLLVVATLLLTVDVLPAPGEEPDGTVKITRRSVSEAVGLSWGEGVLSYQGKEYSFTFQASGLLREIDRSIAVEELAGQVFNLKRLEHFNGTYTMAEAGSVGDSGKQATLKNQNGVVLNIAAAAGGHKFSLGAEGMKIELKK